MHLLIHFQFSSEKFLPEIERTKLNKSKLNIVKKLKKNELKRKTITKKSSLTVKNLFYVACQRVRVKLKLEISRCAKIAKFGGRRYWRQVFSWATTLSTKENPFVRNYFGHCALRGRKLELEKLIKAHHGRQRTCLETSEIGWITRLLRPASESSKTWMHTVEC